MRDKERMRPAPWHAVFRRPAYSGGEGSASYSTPVIGDPDAIRRDWLGAEVVIKPAPCDLLKRAVLAVSSLA